MTYQSIPSVPSIGGTPSAPSKTFSIGKAAKVKRGQRIIIYGTGGIGKSTLATLAPNPAVIDVEDSTSEISVPRISGVETIRDLRNACRDNSLWKGVDTVIIDSFTKVQEMAGDDVLARIKPEKGDRQPECLEDYGYGKGYRYVYDVMNPVLNDTNGLIAAGKNVILICHDITETVPNPAGDDYLQFQPKLQNSKQSNMRARAKEWCDHLLFLHYDIAINSEGLAKGGGTRTIYAQERPHFWAKSRSLTGPYVFKTETDDSIWKALFKETK